MNSSDNGHGSPGGPQKIVSKSIRVGHFVHFLSFKYCLFRCDFSLFVCLSVCLSHEHLLHASFSFFILLKSITACYLAEARNFLHQVSDPTLKWNPVALSEIQALEWVFCLPVLWPSDQAGIMSMLNPPHSLWDHPCSTILFVSLDTPLSPDLTLSLFYLISLSILLWVQG